MWWRPLELQRAPGHQQHAAWEEGQHQRQAAQWVVFQQLQTFKMWWWRRRRILPTSKERRGRINGGLVAAAWAMVAVEKESGIDLQPALEGGDRRRQQQKKLLTMTKSQNINRTIIITNYENSSRAGHHHNDEGQFQQGSHEQKFVQG